MTVATVTQPHNLRPGQREALTRWAEALRGGARSELVVVPVGYGKTVIGVGSFEVARALGGADTCLYLTPTDVLRSQVYAGVERALAIAGSSQPVRKILADNAAPDRVYSTKANVVVATYQQVVAAPGVYGKLARHRRLHLVCDEAHHLGESGRWSGAIASLPVRTALLLSATPVRLDRDAIAGARYTTTEDGFRAIDPLVQVSMREAWRERRILKHLNIQLKDYAVQLRGRDGEIHEFSASEMADLPGFDQSCVRQQLRWNEDYVAPLVREFALALEAKLGLGPGRHQGLVFAATTGHANHLYRLFARWHPSLRCTVVHSGDIADGENERRLREFHEGRHHVLIQVKKASEGFDAPGVSVILKLDAVFSREPVIQQLGRGLRYNHALPESQNLLNVFIGRDPRLAGLIEQLEHDAPPLPLQPRAEGLPGIEVELDAFAQDRDDLEADRPEVVDVIEAGDAYLDHEGRFVEGQQLTMFGVAPPPVAPPRGSAPAPAADVVDLAAELREAVEHCTTWTNRAARERARLRGPGENHHAALHLAYARETGRRGALSTPAQYRAKGDWMKRRCQAPPR